MKKVPLFLFLTIVSNIVLLAQSPQVKLTGNAGVAFDFYNYAVGDTTDFRARRPPFNYRLFVNPVFQFGDKFSLPVSINISKRQTNLLLPLPRIDSPLDYLTDPTNNVGITPTFKWGKFFIGSHVPRISDLSVGNIPIFGAGMDLQLGLFRVASSAGYSHFTVEADTLNGIRGVHRRFFEAAKIGIGKPEGSGIYFNAVRVRDRPDSIIDDAFFDEPERGLTLTADFSLRLSKKLRWRGEIANASYSKDTRALPLPADAPFPVDLPTDLFPLNQETRNDQAAKTEIIFNAAAFGMVVRGEYFGAGFKSLGYPFRPSDVFDLTASPRLSLFNNRWQINGTIGRRTDNLSGTKIAPSNRLIVSANTVLQISKNITLTGVYADFGTRTNIDNDTLKVEFVSRNLSITPAFTFGNKDWKHRITLNRTSAEFDDLNLLTGDQNDNRNTVYSVNYGLGHGEWNFGMGASRLLNRTFFLETLIYSSNLRVEWRSTDKKWRVGLTGLYTHSSFSNFSDEQQWQFRPRLSWQITPKTQLRLRGLWRVFEHGNRRLIGTLQEQFLQTNISHTF